MQEELDLIVEMSKESMKNSIDYLEKKLLNIRAGKANPNMLSSVIVDYYGAKTPLAQMANINTPDAKTLIIQPWDKTALEEIEKAIEIANIGFNPMNNGDHIIISVPALTEERRIQLVKQVKSEIEDAKISVRNARKDANNEIKNICNVGLMNLNMSKKMLSQKERNLISIKGQDFDKCNYIISNKIFLSDPKYTRKYQIPDNFKKIDSIRRGNIVVNEIYKKN